MKRIGEDVLVTLNQTVLVSLQDVVEKLKRMAFVTVIAIVRKAIRKLNNA